MSLPDPRVSRSKPDEIEADVRPFHGGDRKRIGPGVSSSSLCTQSARSSLGRDSCSVALFLPIDLDFTT